MGGVGFIQRVGVSFVRSTIEEERKMAVRVRLPTPLLRRIAAKSGATHRERRASAKLEAARNRGGFNRIDDLN